MWPRTPTERTAEAYLAQTLGGESQLLMGSRGVARYIDQLAGGVAHESKRGFVSMRPEIIKQITADANLVADGKISGVAWHFFTSPRTGIGAS